MQPISKRSVLKPALEKQDTVPVPVLEVMIAGWLQEDDMCDTDKTAITALASVLDLETYVYAVPKEKLAKAASYFEEQERKIVEEVLRLESLTKALRWEDPFGTKILLESLGIDDVDPLDEEIEDLPVEIAGAVEKSGDYLVDISFPLSSWTDLQRSAMGVGEAKMLLVRLFVDRMSDVPASFVAYLDTDMQDVAPGNVYCAGKATLLIWQISRFLYEYIAGSGSRIEGIHNFITRKMNELAHTCKLPQSTECFLAVRNSE
jgi:hypothetical protein